MNTTLFRSSCSSVTTSSLSITYFDFSTFLFLLILVLKLLAFSYISLVTPSGFFPGAIPCTLNNSSAISTVPSSYHSTVFYLNVTEPLSDSVRLPIGTVPVSSNAS